VRSHNTAQAPMQCLRHCLDILRELEALVSDCLQIGAQFSGRITCAVEKPFITEAEAFHEPVTIG
jgi:hypothetical protein